MRNDVVRLLDALGFYGVIPFGHSAGALVAFFLPPPVQTWFGRWCWRRCRRPTRPILLSTCRGVRRADKRTTGAPPARFSGGGTAHRAIGGQ